jgi:hypothetical protein
MLEVGNNTNLDVVNEVAGVDNPYEEYLVPDGHFELTTLPPQVPPQTTTQDGGGRPTRDRKQVSRLIPSFKGNSYGTTMAQVIGEMVLGLLWQVA